MKLPFHPLALALALLVCWARFPSSRADAQSTPSAKMRIVRCELNPTEGRFGRKRTSKCRSRTIECAIYEPCGAAPGRKLPVAIAFHGAGAGLEDQPHCAWDELCWHLAGRGAYVVAPIWNAGDNLLWPCAWQENALGGVSAGIQYLNRCAAAAPDWDRTVVVGHSMGGMFALRLAELAQRCPALPRPRAIVLHDAAGFSYAPWLSATLPDVRRGKYTIAPYDSYCGIDPNTLLVVLLAEVTFDEDRAREACGGRAGWGNSNSGGVTSRAWHCSGIDSNRRHAFVVMGDPAACPPRVSDHGGPASPVDEIDRIYWRMTDAAINAALSDSEFAPDISDRWPSGRSQAVRLESLPPAKAFVWNCGELMVETRLMKWFVPRGVCRRY